MNILFASSEAHPLVKTGGLADVCGSLPAALRKAGQDVRLVLPAYPAAIEKAGKLTLIGMLNLPGAATPVRLLRGRLPGTRVKLYLIDAPEHFDRPGNPYTDRKGEDWADNAARFALFAQAICALALDQAGLGWRPDLVHCNDWQTGLVPAWLAQQRNRPATLFTIHNLAYQGVFSHRTFKALQLPAEWWSLDKLEFHDRFAFIKGGLVYADWINTVSPTYAREICTPAFGCGLEGLLQHRKNRLSGILNGVDYRVWSPGRDRLIARNYNARTLKRKVDNKHALQTAFGLAVDDTVPLLGHVGRLVEQKGLDLVIQLIPQLAKRNVQLVVLGTGDKSLENALRKAAKQHPANIAVRIEYDEQLSHLVEAGSDIFLMPSRFEPCGLNQIYSLRYGTPPVVRHTGGLADTVDDSNGFSFDAISATALMNTIDRALESYANPDDWRTRQQQGMGADFSWSRSAQAYLALYRQLLETGNAPQLARKAS